MSSFASFYLVSKLLKLQSDLIIKYRLIHPSICLAVSKPWKRFLESSNDLWTTLDTRSARRGVRMDSLKAYLRRSKYGVDRAYFITKTPYFSSRQLEMITRTCKRLKYLECSDTGSSSPLGTSLLSALPMATGLRTLIIKNCSMLFSQIVEALSICPLLEHVEFHRVIGVPSTVRTAWPQLENLASLLLIFEAGHSFVSPLNLVRILTSIQDLGLSNLYHTFFRGACMLRFDPNSELER
jgi:hypothetical protein